MAKRCPCNFKFSVPVGPKASEPGAPDLPVPLELRENSGAGTAAMRTVVLFLAKGQVIEWVGLSRLGQKPLFITAGPQEP